MKIHTGETEGILSEHGGEYDLADDAPPPAQFASRSPVPTLSYAGATPAPSRPAAPQSVPGFRGGAADPRLARIDRLRDVTIPLAVCLVGSILYLGAAWRLSGDFVIASVWVAVNVLFELLTVGVTLVIAAWMLDDAVGEAKAATLKIAALVLGPAGISTTLLWVDGGHLAGGLVGFFLGSIAFCALLSYLFEFEFPEVATTIGVNLLVVLAANSIWLGLIGRWGYVPA